MMFGSLNMYVKNKMQAADLRRISGRYLFLAAAAVLTLLILYKIIDIKIYSPRFKVKVLKQRGRIQNLYTPRNIKNSR
ncbi:MAG TPA: hypothetical protein VKS21_04985, partial [Spirochaetota bacterium]|nr:hypothetical protein [Spirochaetota bacterium]